MPKSCCVTGCTNSIQRKPEFQYYILPQDKARRKLWLTAIGRAHIDSSGEGNQENFGLQNRDMFMSAPNIFFSRIYIITATFLLLTSFNSSNRLHQL